MNMLWWIFCGAAGLWIGMPNPVASFPAAALLYPASLFLLGTGSTSWKHAFRLGWLCGLAGASACLYWLAIPVHDFGGLPWALAAPCPLLMGAYIGLYGGLFAALAHARTASKALCWGSYRNVLVQPKQLIFERRVDGERVLVAINADSSPFDAHFDAGCGRAVDLITGDDHDFGGGSRLEPFSCYFWKCER